MKRFLSLCLALALCLCLTSCVTTDMLSGKTITGSIGPDGKPEFGITFPAK